MGWQVTAYTAPMLGAALISFLLAGIAFRSRDHRTALPLVGLLVGTGVWCAASGLQISSTTLGAKEFWRNVRFLGPTTAVPSVLLFAAEFTNREQWLGRRRVGLILVPEVLINVAVWTNPAHGLFRAGGTMTTDPGFRAMEIEFGPLFAFEALYQYALLLVMTYWLLGEFRRSRNETTDVYQSQAGLVLVAIVIPWLVNVAFVVGLTEVDLTPLGFLATGLLFAVGFFRYQILDLVPVARGTVVDNIGEAYLVFNPRNAIVDANETAVEIIDAPREAIVGATFEAVFSDFPSVLDRFGDARDVHEQIELEREGSTRYYDVTVSSIYDRRDRYLGRVVLFRDVTQQERRKRQLEQQNEQLEEFAHIVSHDLRNPLNVAKGRIQMVDDEQADVIERNLDRMGSIVDDTLTLARQGQRIEETEPVDLAELCREVWETVETGDATAEFPVERTVEADRGRLRHVFENLFRNALEHGQESVTITVGALPDGFYVADNGGGIPADEREKVLEKGYTTADEGTGLGLSIVRRAVEAHGWTVTITESDDGGARFEVRGLGEDRPGE